MSAQVSLRGLTIREMRAEEVGGARLKTHLIGMRYAGLAGHRAGYVHVLSRYSFSISSTS